MDFKRNRDFYLLTRTPAEIRARAKKEGLPLDTWGIAWFNGPIDGMMLPPPPEMPKTRHGWKWWMWKRDVAKWGEMFAHEFNHLIDGQWHEFDKKRPISD